METALRKPWTQEDFLDWAEIQEARYEFDGFEPVAMNGGTINHELIGQNIRFALNQRLTGGPCMPLGPTIGIATANDAIRFPDAVVTCSPLIGTARLVPSPVVVFEVLSPTSAPLACIIKPREYAAIPTILRYVIVELTYPGLTVLTRSAPRTAFLPTSLAAGDTLEMPEIATTLLVDEIYEGVTFTT